MKNPMEKLSARSIRALYTLLALLVFGICAMNFSDLMIYKVLGNDKCAWIPIDSVGTRLLIRDVVPDGVTARAGVHNGDILLEIGGKPFKNSGDAQSRINAVKSEEYISYLLERNGMKFETKVQILRTFNVVYFSQFLYGLVFLIVGLVVVIVRPQGKIQRLFANYSILTMLFFGLANLSLNPDVDPAWKIRLLGSLFIAASFFSLPVFTRFFMFFPVKRALYQSKLFTGAL